MGKRKSIESKAIKQSIGKFLNNIFRSSYLGTFIVDAYNKDDAHEIAEALDEICMPTDNVGWSSSGIYCFWDYYTREILYIGLATDLPTRFRQHNGILKTNKKGSKSQKINTYFREHKLLGYSIFPQSSLAQPEVFRNKKVINYNSYEHITEETKEIIEVVEGCFIESFNTAYGHLPHWNEKGGSKTGQKKATLEIYDLLHSGFTGNVDNILVAKSSLREIANNSVFELFELQLHGARMSMLSRFLSFDDALSEQLQRNPIFLEVYEEILSSQYLAKEPQICFRR